MKSEQAQRIGFRDNLLYVTLGLFATIISFAVSNSKVKEHTGYTDLETLFGWEFTHRDDKHCKRRKIQQLIVDEITFVFSGVIAVAAFWFLVPKPPLGMTILSWVELLLLIALGVETFIYADLKKER